MVQTIIQGKKYRFSLLTEKLLRMEYSEEGIFTDSQTQVVLNRDFEEVPHKLIEKEDKIEIITSSYHLYYQKEEAFNSKSLTIDFAYSFSHYHNQWRFGEKIVNLKGTLRTVDEIDGSAPLEDGILSRNGFAILDDSASFSLDSTGDPKPRNKDLKDVYIFAYGHDYQTALKDYFRLTGFPPKLPRYALGNWWSRYWKYTEQEYKELITRFEKNKIPFSVAVLDMDWHITEVPEKYGSGWTGYTWNRELFPEPKEFLDWLHEHGLAVTLNVHPADGIRGFEEQYPIVSQKLNLVSEIEEPAKFDLNNPDFRKVYFEDVNHPLEEMGVDFWWLDWQQGEESSIAGLDPLWTLNHYHILDMQKQGKAPLILSRYAGPGSHRYPIGFSGDSIVSWDSLAFQPYMTATASNIGYTWWSHDIGGHMHGYKDEELALRWLQFGVFSPINRLHSSSSPFFSKEPWIYRGDIEKIMTNFLQLRHELLPYLFTMNVRTAEKGIPLIRPIYYDYPEEEGSYAYQNEYFFGSELLVSPIIAAENKEIHLAENKMFFPEGDWYDLFSNLRYSGNSELAVYRSLETIPVFVKAGGILPFDGEVGKTIGENLPECIQWKIFPGKSNQFEMIEEKDGKQAITKVVLDYEKEILTLSVMDEEGILPQNRQHIFVFCGTEMFEPHCEMGQLLPYDLEKTERSFLLEEPFKEQVTIAIKGFQPIKIQVIRKEFFERINHAEISFDEKERIWNFFKSTSDAFKLTAFLQQIENDTLRQALYELIYIQRS
ncbi:glycoside hydrolase family 31 protein [Enterococcus sp. JM9B]|uniref:glycoside hydrolase family 31 protein n=1 Tax=Enterococcus sp. JM9B TaxID=1857216 RepID=UPI001374E918|nr:TIM-barrel domain-containing protein [Enterococcus sp. JM9B]KAF1303157.1 alpha-xylosidase [Enterococcus sp. JM9B]